MGGDKTPPIFLYPFPDKTLCRSLAYGRSLFLFYNGVILQPIKVKSNITDYIKVWSSVTKWIRQKLIKKVRHGVILQWA